MTAAHSPKRLVHVAVFARPARRNIGPAFPDLRRVILPGFVFVDGKIMARLGFDFNGAQGVEARLFGRAGDGGDFLAVKTHGELAVAHDDGGLDAGNLAAPCPG